MARSKEIPVDSFTGTNDSNGQADNSEFKKIALCLGVIALRSTHIKFKRDNERIPFLKKLGFTNHDIAGILNSTSESVRVSQAIGKRKSKQKSKSNGDN